MTCRGGAGRLRRRRTAWAGDVISVLLDHERMSSSWVRTRSASERENRELLGGRGALAFDDQLAAGGTNIAAPALAHRHDDAVLGDNPRESVDGLVCPALEWNAPRRVQRNQRHLRS